MSSFRRSHQSSSSHSEFDIRFEKRNDEDVHQAALEASRAFHEQINEAARRAHALHEARTEQLRLQQLATQEEERIRLLEEQAREEIRLREIENRARQIPKVPEKAPTQTPSTFVQVPKPITPPSQLTPAPVKSTAEAVAQPATISNILRTTSKSPKQPTNPFAQPHSRKGNPFGQQPSQSSDSPLPKSSALAPNPFPRNAQTSTTRAQVQSATQLRAPSLLPQPASAPAQKHSFLLRGVDKYAEIHRALKQMRRMVTDACDTDQKFKKAVGELRRELRMKLGQIVKDKSQNKEPMNRIFKILEGSLQIPSPGVDPSVFMLSKPESCEGALNNGEQIPVLFIFLLNMFAKYAISQFINEAGANPEIADPIGVIVVQVFARASFLWRGQSLVDIFMAKMRVVCPVVFGIRGNEITEQGRASLGWVRESKDQGASYMSEEQHGSRMAGLAAGYAAISLRDFSKSSLKNPWHPTHYWQTIASIVATPPNERSITQYLVLHALIDGFEATFLKFYGNAARAALHVALIAFPQGASAPGSSVDPGSSAVGGVMVLADKLARRGIDLRA